MIENSTVGLTLLDPDHEVVVTREEYHQPALQAYGPHDDGRGRRVAVELAFAPSASSRHRGRPGIEVRLDGRRVGELTALMSERYRPAVEDVLRRGGRPACLALVTNGRRGVEVQLRLPVVSAGAGPMPPAGAPSAPSTARRRRTPILIGTGVAALLIVVGASIGHGGGERTATATGSTTAPAPSATASPVTVAPTTQPAPSSSPVVAPAAVPPAAVPAAVPTPSLPETSTRRTTTAPRPAPAVRPTARAAPAPRATPEPAPKAAPKPTSSCDPNYSGCVPIASDVACAGGSGNGPAYVTGPVRVTGNDIYGLDADNDGIGCE